MWKWEIIERKAGFDYQARVWKPRHWILLERVKGDDFKVIGESDDFFVLRDKAYAMAQAAAVAA